jgi:hypothetical protein
LAQGPEVLTLLIRNLLATDNRKDASLLQNLSFFCKLRVRNALKYRPKVITSPSIFLKCGVKTFLKTYAVPPPYAMRGDGRSAGGGQTRPGQLGDDWQPRHVGGR